MKLLRDVTSIAAIVLLIAFLAVWQLVLPIVGALYLLGYLH